MKKYLVFGIIIGIIGVAVVSFLVYGVFVISLLTSALQSLFGEVELDFGLIMLRVYLAALVFEVVIYFVSLSFRKRWIKLFYIASGVLSLVFAIGLIVSGGNALVLIFVGGVGILPISDALITHYRKLRALPEDIPETEEELF